MGGVNTSDCEACTPGYYCAEYHLTAPNGHCDPGYFCPGGQDTAQPAEYACSPGHTCPVGSHNQTGCPSGYYQPHWRQYSCDDCPAGSFCKAFGDFESLDDDVDTTYGNFSRYRSYRGVSVPTVCPAGSYCPINSEHGLQYLCPNGTYSNQTGLQRADQCTPCDPGWFCGGEGTFLHHL